MLYSCTHMATVGFKGLDVYFSSDGENTNQQLMFTFIVGLLVRVGQVTFSIKHRCSVLTRDIVIQQVGLMNVSTAEQFTSTSSRSRLHQKHTQSAYD